MRDAGRGSASPGEVRAGSVSTDRIAYLGFLLALVSFAAIRALGVAVNAETAYRVGVGLLTFSIIVAIVRGGVQSWVFVITVACVYPALTPWLARSVLGYRWYTGLQIPLQTVFYEGEPVLVAGLACSAMAFGLARPLRVINAPWVPVSMEWGHRAVAIAAAAGIGAMVFAYVTEPGGIVYFSSYAQIQSDHLKAVPFASGAWAVFACVGLYFWVQSLSAGSGIRVKWMQRWFWVSIGGSCLYLLLHAHRSELLGFAFLMIGVSAGRIPRWKVVVAAGLLVVGLVVVGDIRSRVYSLDLGADLGADAYALPGGPGNVSIGWVSEYWLLQSGRLHVWPGETYLGHLIRLPPSFLGLERPPTAYDYVDMYTPLIGGEYFLNEPMLNFGIAGIAFYIVVFVWVARRAQLAVARGTLRGFVYGGTFMALIMRTLWYGIGALVKSEIVALLVVGALALLWLTARQARGRVGVA